MNRQNSEGSPREISVAEAGRKGGEKVREKYGSAFYSAIGRKGGRATQQKHGAEFYGEIGRKGGMATSRRHGPDFYTTIGKRGGQRVRELIARGKKSEA